MIFLDILQDGYTIFGNSLSLISKWQVIFLSLMKAEVCHLNCFIIVWWLLPVRINVTCGKLRTDNLRFIHISLNFHWKWNIVFTFRHTRNADAYRFLGGNHDHLGSIVQGAASFVLEAEGCGDVCGFWEHLFVRIFIILTNTVAQA